MSNFEVWPTAVADRQLRDLRGETRKHAKGAMDRLERRGCEAADYRLEGDEVERLCVGNLGRDWRMIVAFPECDEVAVILVGRHLEKRPQVDVYRRPYETRASASTFRHSHSARGTRPAVRLARRQLTATSRGRLHHQLLPGALRR
jgi:hypothetical protein